MITLKTVRKNRIVVDVNGDVREIAVSPSRLNALPRAIAVDKIARAVPEADERELCDIVDTMQIALV